MSDKLINRLFIAYLHNYYCNYHSGPVPRLNFRVWLFLAYFGPEDLATLSSTLLSRVLQSSLPNFLAISHYGQGKIDFFIVLYTNNIKRT